MTMSESAVKKTQRGAPCEAPRVFCPYQNSLGDIELRHIDRRIAHVVLRLHRNDLRRSLGRRRLLFRSVRHGEDDAAVTWIDLVDAHVETHRLIHDVGGTMDGLPGGGELRERNEALDVVADVDDDALVHEPDDAARELRTDRIRLTDAEPRIFLGLLETEADALVLRVDVQDHDVDGVALLHDFRRMLHALGPAHIRDMNQPIDTRLDFYERAEAGEVADLPRDARADRVLERQHHPRILLRLFHAERDLLLVRIDLEDDGFNRLADRDELRGVADVSCPAHLADVHETLDARLELDERTVVRDRDDLPRDARADRILVGDVLPRIRLQLLEPEADALARPIDVEHLDLELRADLHELGRMRDAAPRHVGDVQQAVDATEIDERTEVGDVLDDALPHLILLELLHQLFALARPLVLEDHSARDDDVAATFIELDDFELELLAEQLVDVRHAAERDLRAREERVDAHEVDHDATLDLLDECALYRRVVLIRDADLLPHAHEVGFLLRKNDRAF